MRERRDSRRGSKRHHSPYRGLSVLSTERAGIRHDCPQTPQTSVGCLAQSGPLLVMRGWSLDQHRHSHCDGDDGPSRRYSPCSRRTCGSRSSSNQAIKASTVGCTSFKTVLAIWSRWVSSRAPEQTSRDSPRGALDAPQSPHRETPLAGSG